MSYTEFHNSSVQKIIIKPCTGPNMPSENFVHSKLIANSVQTTLLDFWEISIRRGGLLVINDGSLNMIKLSQCSLFRIINQ